MLAGQAFASGITSPQELKKGISRERGTSIGRT
jgi:hypothetical protein